MKQRNGTQKLFAGQKMYVGQQDITNIRVNYSPSKQYLRILLSS